MDPTAPASDAARQSDRERKREHERALKLRPFLDDELMTSGTPQSCSRRDFKTRRLRKFPFEFRDLSFVDRIIPDPDSFLGKVDGGLDGYNWKVRFKGCNDGPFVMKVFWDYKPPEHGMYYGVQRECQNAAILQKIETALSPETASRGPVLKLVKPQDWDECQYNYYSFCDERREKHKRRLHKLGPDFEQVTSMPRFRKCYGWLQVSSRDIEAKIPRRLQPGTVRSGKLQIFLHRDALYTAIIYEYIEEGENVVKTVQQSIDFLLDAGFGYNLSARAANWTNSILLDWADFVHVEGVHWNRGRRYLLRAKAILRRA